MARCFLVIVAASIPIRLSMTEHGHSFWATFAWAWHCAFAILGACQPPKMSLLEIDDAYGFAGCLGGVFAWATQACAIVCAAILFAIAWNATGTKNDAVD